ncbi:hypothetical protein HDU96_004262 [Phlyctochytrium bullatum]|nr:hypothetical protein HDU96_004262 [Phlyctochytrium bullatum]
MDAEHNPNTLRKHDRYWKKFVGWCEPRGTDPHAPPLAECIEFLAAIGRTATTQDPTAEAKRARAALAFILPAPAGHASLAHHPEVQSLFGGMTRLQPRPPTIRRVFDPELLWHHLATAMAANWGAGLDEHTVDEARDVPYGKYLLPKLNFLLHLLDKKRSSDTISILLLGLEIQDHQVRYCQFRGKGWRKGHSDVVARVVPRLTATPALDVGLVFQRILRRSAGWRDATKMGWGREGPKAHAWLLLKPSKGHAHYLANTLGSDCTRILRNNVHLPTDFSCHSIHSSVAQAQREAGLPDDLINNGRWRSDTTMRSHYLGRTAGFWRPANYQDRVPYDRPYGWTADLQTQGLRPDAFSPIEPPAPSITIGADDEANESTVPPT